jgi:hypothetical protein
VGCATGTFESPEKSSATAGSLAIAGPPPADLPTTDQILENYVTALGGKEALESVTSRVMKGVVEEGLESVPQGIKLQPTRLKLHPVRVISYALLVGLMGGGGAARWFGVPPLIDEKRESPDEVLWEVQAKAPSKLLMTAEGRFPDGQKPNLLISRRGFNGIRGWDKNCFAGLREERGEDLAKLRMDSDFYRQIRLKEIYPDLSMEGRAMADGEEVYVLKSVPATDRTERFAFSKETGLLVCQESEYRTKPYGFAAGARPRMRAAIHFSNYQAANGVKVPMNLRWRVGAVGWPAKEISIRFTEISHNFPVDDALFEMPAN